MKTSGIGITLFVWLLSSASAPAVAEDVPMDSPDSSGLRLKLQPALIPFLPGADDGDLPLFIDADQLSGHQDRETEAEGAVRLRRRGQAFYADWLRYDQPANQFDARGNVRIEQGSDVLEGSTLHYDLSSGKGELAAPRYEVNAGAVPGHGNAEQLFIDRVGKYRITHGNYTTCGPDDPDWIIRADDFEIDKIRQVGTAHNASIVFLGVPIFYSPYLSFSLDRSRKSGFLAPSLVSNGNVGLGLSLPYYWNIAPNYDATLTPTYLTKRGDMLGTEFRYLNPQYKGEVRFDILPSDRVLNGQQRDALFLHHDQAWNNGWYGSVDVQRVSDDKYFTDLSTQIAFTSQALLPRQGVLGRSGTLGSDGVWNFTTLVQHWQTLQPDPLVPVTAPYNRAPQITFTANKPNLAFLDLDFASSYTDFTHPSLTNGQRTTAYPSLSLPLQTSFAYFTPKVGVHYTHYDLDPLTTGLPNSQDRTVPIVTADSGLIFERAMAWQGRDLTQTIEPRLYYVYIPARDQNLLPNFDSAVQDLNFATLFTENQFSGSDRINDANQVTAGVSSRFIEQDGVERLRVAVAQRYYFSTQSVTLPGVPPRSSNSSDLLALISGRVSPSWTVDSSWQYTTDIQQTQRLLIGTRYQPEPGKLLNVGYRYTSGALKQVDISGQWPLSRHLSGVARWNYSIPDSQMLEGLAGLEYNNGCCWALQLVAHRFTTATSEQSNSIMLVLQLNGVSEFGSNPIELLRRSVAGYGRQTVQTTLDDDPLVAH